MYNAQKGAFIAHVSSYGAWFVPCRDKIPLQKGWQLGCNYNPLESNQNYGVVMGDKLVCLDWDYRAFLPLDWEFLSAHNEWFYWYELLKILDIIRLFDVYGLRDTLTVLTPSGGFHFYYSVPQNNYAGKLEAHIDVKGERSYCIGVGSSTNGREYTLLIDTPISVLPDGILQPKIPPQPIDLPNVEIDDPFTIQYYQQYLSKIGPAVEGASGDLHTFKVIAYGRDLGLSQNVILSPLLEWDAHNSPEWGASGLTQKIKNVYQYAKAPQGNKSFDAVFGVEPTEKKPVAFRWDLNKDGTKKKTLNNAVNLIKFTLNKTDNRLRFDKFAKTIVFDRGLPFREEISGVFCESDVIQTRYILSATHEFDVPANTIYEAAHIVANEDAFNPVHEYLQSLVWDGVPRVDTWLVDTFGVDNKKYTRLVSRKTLLGAVWRAFQPGCKFDHILVIEGDQGIGKSTICEKLGKKWFADFNLDPNSKDTVSAILGKWIIILSEMAANRKSENDAFKAFITRTEDRVRLPYARLSEDFPRACIFIGTINREETGYLKDATGSRRFWPVKATRKADFEAFDGIVDQLWAESVHYYRLGERPMLDGEDAIEAQDEANSRRVFDPLTERIREFLVGKTSVAVDDIWYECIGGTHLAYKPHERQRLITVLKDLNWEGRTNNGVYKWFPKRG